MNDEEERKNKGMRGFLRRKWKAVKRPFSRRRRKTKVEVQTPDKEQSRVSSVSVYSASESVSLQENKRQGEMK